MPAGPPLSGESSTPLRSKPMSLSTSVSWSATPTPSSGILDQQRAVQAESDLRRGHHVRVIPVESGVAHDEVVGERLAALDCRLRDVGHAVHLDRHPHAMPVNRRRLRQVVREVDDHAIADARADERSREAAVVGPRLHLLTRRDLDVRDARGQVDFDDLRIGIAVLGFGKREAVAPAVGRERRRRLRSGHPRAGNPRARDTTTRVHEAIFPERQVTDLIIAAGRTSWYDRRHTARLKPRAPVG